METAPIRAELPTEIMALDAARLAPIVEQAVERVGELGQTAFEAIDAYQARDGVGGSFSRGVHILSVLRAGEHQLTRLLFGRVRAETDPRPRCCRDARLGRRGKD
jgi:hypothetical protein